MANSRRFYNLTLRLNKLRRHFLPKVFSPTGYYSDRQQDLAKAYKLLAHAEIESYIEEVSKKTIVNKVRKWKANKIASDSIICLLSFYHAGWSTSEGDDFIDLISNVETQAKAMDSSEAAVQVAVKQYLGKILSNNGVKQADLKKMVLPLGVRLDDLDPTWLILLDSFGSSRGDIAHNTSAVLHEVNPQDELNIVTELVSGLKRLDELILGIK